MAYKSFVNCTEEEYKNVIYSQDSRNKIQILFNSVELEDADYYCESFRLNSRIIPNGSKVFGLNSFVANEAELILHDVDVNTIVDDVRISIGTLVNDTYEYVPIGIFHIQDKPVTDKNKVTIKLRDSSVKFDFNYNAEPLITNNGGSATKFQIFQDICTQAGVTTQIASFLGSEDVVSVYDNSKTARQYIAWLAEQSGAVATISREDELIFIYLNELEIVDVPLYYVEKYENGEPYKIERIVYEDAIRKFESPDPTLETMAEEEEQSQEKKGTLYLDTANPYISSQEQVDSIFEEVGGFEINSFNTGKVLGNPAIDSYDLIEILENSTLSITWDGDVNGKDVFNSLYYKISDIVPDRNDLIEQQIIQLISGVSRVTKIREYMIHDYENSRYPINPGDITSVQDIILIVNKDIVFDENRTLYKGIYFSKYSNGYVLELTLPKNKTYKTLATNTLTYNGVMIQEFDTKIGLEARQENVTKTGEQLYRQYVQTEINNLDLAIIQTILKQNEQGTQINETIRNLESTTSKVGTLEGNMTTLSQKADSIDGSVKKIGGNNMVINSVGYYKLDKYTQQSKNAISEITWDGDGTDREKYGNALYKVSDLTPTKEELMGQTVTAISSTGEANSFVIDTVTNTTQIMEENENIYCGTFEEAGGFPYIVVIKETTIIDDITYTMGTYFYAYIDEGITSAYVSKLTLPSSINNSNSIVMYGRNPIFYGVSDSEAGFIITNDKITHEAITGFVIGKEYTLTFKYFNDVNNHLIFKFYNDDEEITLLDINEQKDLTEVVHTFIANDTTCYYSIESISLETTTCGITDLIIKGGNTRSDWESAPAEIQGTNIAIYYNGIEVTSVDDNIKTVINNIGFSIVNDNGNIMVTVNKDRVLLNNTEIKGYFKFNSFLWQEMEINGDTHLLIT